MTATLAFVIILVFLALVFDYINGFHDAANSIATIVSTRVLSPGMAVVWAAFFNFIAFIVLGEAVAKTIGKDMVDIKAIPPTWQLWVLLCGLVGAITWNLITWYYGIPSSSSHALIGGIVGAGVAKAGISALIAAGILKTVAFIFISPLIGMVLIAAGYTGATEPVPVWVVVSCYVTIGLGTLFGGWRIVKTMGQRITKIRPVGGFCAELSGSVALFIATGLGVP